MLGKDAAKVEYWHFKDDPTRIYTRVEEVILSEELDEVSGEQKVDGFKYQWNYYDEEDSFDALVESLNPRGVRERKLQENLKKIKDRMKLKKAKKVAVAEATGDVEMTTEEKPATEEQMQVDTVEAPQGINLVF
jgi:hypothetical protein